jgi:hypothetical protein
MLAARRAQAFVLFRLFQAHLAPLIVCNQKKSRLESRLPTMTR